MFWIYSSRSTHLTVTILTVTIHSENPTNRSSRFNRSTNRPKCSLQAMIMISNSLSQWMLRKSQNQLLRAEISQNDRITCWENLLKQTWHNPRLRIFGGRHKPFESRIELEAKFRNLAEDIAVRRRRD
jgi:hypothetical protein